MNVTAECIDERVVKQGYTLKYKKFFSQAPKFIHFLYTSFPEYLGTTPDRAVITDYPDLMNYDAFVIMSEAHLKSNGQVIFNAIIEFDKKLRTTIQKNLTSYYSAGNRIYLGYMNKPIFYTLRIGVYEHQSKLLREKWQSTTQQNNYKKLNIG